MALRRNARPRPDRSYIIPEPGEAILHFYSQSMERKTTGRLFINHIIIVLLFLFSSVGSKAQKPADSLLFYFQNPPQSARPRVWWHWMNGNINKEGIRKDLEWMHRAGIGGFQNFDAALATPQIVEKRLVYMTPEWKDAFRFATQLADSLRLEMAIAGSPGWSESGGPWVKPEDGMKKYVWTETRVQGGDANIKLPQPPSTTGPFQDLPIQAELGDTSHKAPPVFYKDVAVIAYKLPEADVSLSELKPVVTSSGGHFDLGQLTDGDLATTSLLPSDTTKGYAWIQFHFPQLQIIKAVTLVGGGDRGRFGLNGELKDTRSLEVSNDGQNYKWVCYLPAGDVLEQTIAIPATTANYFRVVFKNPPPPVDLAALFGIPGMPPPKAPPGTDIAELVLSPATRVQMFEEKAAFATAVGLYTKTTPASADAINPDDVIDITGKMSSDGTLDWKVPAGNWNIVRFGYSLLGITNHPATPEATGLEVDKLDSTAIKNYFTRYLDQYKNATGGLMGNAGGLQYMVTDSWEAGAQNWTPGMLQEFQKRRGYSMIPWMPVLSGHLVKSAEASDAFLWDFRKTLSEMVAEYHYDGLTKILEQYGMKRYSESHEDRRALIADGMDVKRTAAVPMSAMWMPTVMNGGDQTVYEADVRESASVAHIYGQNLAAAESFSTSSVGGNAFSYAPENLKPTADLELANGLNRFVIHTSVHQPVDDKIPGLSLASVGQWFTRHETWAEEARAWTDYLSRSSYMLQQGKFVADIVYYYGEDNNITSLFGKKLPDIPEGYNYDFINSDALLNLLSVKNGKLVTPSGMSYRVLVLDSNAKQMPLPVLKKISALVKAGAVVTGIKPQNTPALNDDTTEFKNIVDEVWNINNAKVFTGKSLAEVLTAINVHPDFSYVILNENSAKKSDIRHQTSDILFVHRKLSNGDIYWVNNRRDTVEDIEATFRVASKVPEVWHPETGSAESASYTIANDITKVNLHLQPNDAVFVVFKKKAATASYILPAAIEQTLASIKGEWNIAFQCNRGAPAAININELQSWTNNADSGVKYFSGTATYAKTINAPKDWFNKNALIWLDLGEVKNLAEVIVNGQSLGIIWKKPFRVNVTNVLKPGDNKLDIKVTNLWVNRLIGDARPGVTNKITYTTMPFYKASSPLLPSGLLGPVKIISTMK
jgi:hypothetical protein